MTPFFEGFARLGWLAIALVLSYAWTVAVLRWTGKRTLSKLNAFDFVVTIALGSTLATVIVSRDIPLLDGLLALAGLAVLQLVVARVTVASGRFAGLVKATPTALVVDGELQHEAMDRSRIRADEIASAVRKHGLGSVGDVDCVVLETDGTLSVVPEVGDGSALDGVEGIAARRSAP